MRILPLAASVLLAAPLAAASAPSLQPGQWKVEARVVSVDDNVPALLARMIEGRVETYERCVTAAEARRGPGKLLVPKNSRCEFSADDSAGGKLRVRGNCATGEGRMGLDLTGSHDGSSFTARNEATIAHRLGTVNVTAVHEGRRLGACR